MGTRLCSCLVRQLLNPLRSLLPLQPRLCTLTPLTVSTVCDAGALMA